MARSGNDLRPAPCSVTSTMLEPLNSITLSELFKNAGTMVPATPTLMLPDLGFQLNSVTIGIGPAQPNFTSLRRS